jgi:hypothetical protein
LRWPKKVRVVWPCFCFHNSGYVSRPAAKSGDYSLNDMKRLLILGMSLTALSAFGLARATSIGFDAQGLSGPILFNLAAPSPQTLVIDHDDNGNALSGTVVFGGGVILKPAIFLPADPTSVYGSARLDATADGAAIDQGLLNPITIIFSLANPIKNFSVDVINGLTASASYRVADNQGHFDDFTLNANSASGIKTVSFPVSGNVVTITGLVAPGGGPGTRWDFLIDNIHFEEVSVPDAGSTFAMLAGAAAVLPLLRRRSIRA